ncbi:M55 family metallopeptidase [Bombilactobacillus thymidiniphilus]|uniref:M55 family metallopeptidase n=1 Tax=Bombilactobacillus thymidiniphilus TaxID=2923363 RepID=A0ABY4PBR7_9LACO|nr:M55 family metallopeptidase [Bombilactobacillus thymidiniphilus]UQS82981.1 M55 family metallopeptidase [Bombilactobacillus thymidiniphilus]
MKIYISTDVEGLAGITDWNMETQDSAEFRKLYNQQVAWVLQGIQASRNNEQVDTILISDSHAKGNNLNYNYLSDIDERISLINGYPREDYMMSGLDSSFDQVFFVGYHSGIGKTHGNMDHGYSARSAYKLWINGVYQNETTINVAYANELGVPVTLVVGDSALEEQLVQDKMYLTPKIVVTKKSLARYAAMSYPRKLVREQTIAAAEAVVNDPSAYNKMAPLADSFTLKLQLANTAQADVIDQLQEVKRLDGRTVEVQCPSMKSLLNEIIGLVTLGGTQA